MLCCLLCGAGLVAGRSFVVVLFILSCCFVWLVFYYVRCYWLGLGFWLRCFRSFRLSLGWLLLVFPGAVGWFSIVMMFSL